MVGVYIIKSTIKPNRVYVGSSINIIKRWKNHLSSLRYNKHKSKKLQNHYNKYGLEDLQFSIILECEIDILIKNEQYYLDLYCPYFNTCKIAGNTLGYKHSKDTRAKMKKPKSEEHKKKLSEIRQGCIPWNKGIKNIVCKQLIIKIRKPRSEEHKHNISLARKGSVPWNKNRTDLPKHSEETKQKMRKPKKRRI